MPARYGQRGWNGAHLTGYRQDVCRIAWPFNLRPTEIHYNLCICNFSISSMLCFGWVTWRHLVCKNTLQPSLKVSIYETPPNPFWTQKLGWLDKMKVSVVNYGDFYGCLFDRVENECYVFGLTILPYSQYVQNANSVIKHSNEMTWIERWLEYILSMIARSCVPYGSNLLQHFLVLKCSNSMRAAGL